MNDTSRWQGTHQFGRAYSYMLDHDPHNPGTVDRLLLTKMIRLLPQTADYLYGSFSPISSSYKRGSRPHLDALAARLTSGAASPSEALRRLVTFTSSLSRRVPEDVDSLLFGGTEEQIIERGSDWCTDVARVACALCQVAGIASRIVFLFDLSRPYSGHAIIEAYHPSAWGALDALTGVQYCRPDATPATTWTLMKEPSLVAEHARRHPHAVYTNSGQFSAAAIANYDISLAGGYDYTTSTADAYSRSVLEMEAKGWPGGLRWLHGEQIA